MPKLRFATRPELAPEHVADVLREAFGDRCQVDLARGLGGVELMVAKSAWEGVAIRIRERDSVCDVSLYGVIPSRRNRVLVFAPAFLLFVAPAALAVLYFNYIKPRDLIADVSAALESRYGQPAPAAS